LQRKKGKYWYAHCPRVLILPQTKGLRFVVLNQDVSAGTKFFSIEGIWNVFTCGMLRKVGEWVCWWEQITMLSFGKSLLYAEFLPRKKLQDRMPLSLVELVSVVGKVVLSTTESKITFSISCTDANDEDVEVPDVVARVR